MVDVKTFVANVDSVYICKPKYVPECGSVQECDCIGMIKCALTMSGVQPTGLDGTNYAARYTIRSLKKITNVSELKIGYVVLEGRPYNSDDSYPLPVKYLVNGSCYNGDTTNYVHIGTVTKINPLEITHMTKPTAKKDYKLGKWNYFGRLPQVSYKDGVTVMVEYATVIGGSLNLREGMSTSSNRLTIIPNGKKVAVIEHKTEWCKVVYNSYTGYAMAKYLKFENDSSEDSVTITLSLENALALYEALKLSLNK